MLEKLFLQILNMSFTGGIVIAFVLFFRLVLKKAPKVFSYGLWAVALFRLVFPFSFESAFSLLPTKPSPISQNIVFMQTPRIDTGILALNNAVSSILPAATPETSINPLQIWVYIGSLLWVLGMVLLFIYSIATLVKLKKRLQTATICEENIFVSNRINTAFVIGVLHPRIYLPATLSDSERSYVLLHEQTHIRRLDHVVKLLSFLVLCVHWFNPLVWAAFFLCGKDMELSCDEAVIKRLGNDVKKSYSSSLLSLATDRKIVGGTPLAFGEGNTKGRIKNVLNYKKPAFWVMVVSTIAAVSVGVGLMANPKTEPLGFAGVNAVILEIDKDTPSMTVEGIDENSVIGNRCIVTWEKDALITLATNSKLIPLSLDDFSVGDSIVLFIGTVQETYPTRAIASTIQLQPSGASELADLRPMIMINGILYLDTGKESPMGAANQVDGTIKTDVSPNKKPTEHEQSNFGFVGSEYTVGNGFVQVNIDGKWIVFELEKQDTPVTQNIEINIGESTKFTQKEIQQAIDVVIQDFFKDSKHIELHSLSYDEEYSNAQMKNYREDVAPNNMIIISSDFYVDSKAGGAWNSDSDYYWMFILSRDNKESDWTLDDWGY